MFASGIAARRLCLLGCLLVAAFPARAEPTPARQQDLVRLVRHDCGSCHGLTLKGGLGPSLLPDRLQRIPGDTLVATILGGRPGTPMPPWGAFLSEGEAEWIADQLQKGFPE